MERIADLNPSWCSGKNWEWSDWTKTPSTSIIFPKESDFLLALFCISTRAVDRIFSKDWISFLICTTKKRILIIIKKELENEQRSFFSLWIYIPSHEKSTCMKCIDRKVFRRFLTTSKYSITFAAAKWMKQIKNNESKIKNKAKRKSVEISKIALLTVRIGLTSKTTPPKIAVLRIKQLLNINNP